MPHNAFIRDGCCSGSSSRSRTCVKIGDSRSWLTRIQNKNIAQGYRCWQSDWNTEKDESEAVDPTWWSKCIGEEHLHKFIDLNEKGKRHLEIGELHHQLRCMLECLGEQAERQKRYLRAYPAGHQQAEN